MSNVYLKVKEWKNRFPKTVVFRLAKHAKIVEQHLHSDEEIKYVFCGQKNYNSYMINKSCVVAVTNERLLIGQKRLLWGYFFTTITPDQYNDFKVIRNMIWSDIMIDSLDQEIYLSNIDPDGAIDIQKNVTKIMMEEKKKYAKKDR